MFGDMPSSVESFFSLAVGSSVSRFRSTSRRLVWGGSRLVSSWQLLLEYLVYGLSFITCPRCCPPPDNSFSYQACQGVVN